MMAEDDKRSVGRSKYADIPLPRYISEQDDTSGKGDALEEESPPMPVYERIDPLDVPFDSRPASVAEDALPIMALPAGSRYRRASVATGQKKGVHARRPRNASRPALLGACIVLVLVITIMAADAFANGDRIYNGVRVGAVDVSGMTPSEACDAVRSAYEPGMEGVVVTIYADEETLERARAGEDIDESAQASEEISAEDAARMRKVWRADAESLGARIDAEEAAKAAFAVGRADGGFPVRLAAQTFGWHLDVPVNMDDGALEVLASDIDQAIGEPHRDYGIVMQDGQAHVVDGADGVEVDRSWLRERIEGEFLDAGSSHDFAARAEYAPARISHDEAQEVAESVNAGIAQGARLSYGDVTWDASAHDLGKLIRTRIEGKDGAWELVPYYDEGASCHAIITKLRAVAGEGALKVRFYQEDGAMMVDVEADGPLPNAREALVMLEQATLRQSAGAQAPQIAVEGMDAAAPMSLQEAQERGIVTTVAQYRTEYTGGATSRNHNIHLAADLLNNSIVHADGGEWSFNGTVGECNEERGFQGAGAIVGNDTVDEIGGGVCQVATTVFNAAFEGGYTIEQRRNHSVYIASYPLGRDAAISWPELDLVWRNETSDDILVQSSWDDTSVTVNLIGVDPGYAVESHTGELQDVVPFAVRTEEDPGMPAGESHVRQAGENGGTVAVTRDVKDEEGQIVRHDDFVSVYDAKDEIVVTGVGA